MSGATAQDGKNFSDEVYAGMIIVIAYTTLLAPLWIESYYRVYGNHIGGKQ